MSTVVARVPVLQRRLRAEADVLTAYLFGSAARGDADAADLDVAVVLVEGAPARAVLDLQVALEAEVGAAVDLHDLDRLPPRVAIRVVREGRVPVDRDTGARVERELRIRYAHDDLQRVHELVDAGLIGRLSSG